MYYRLSDLRVFLLLLFVAIFSACGGGGGGDSSDSVTINTQPPAQSVTAVVVTAGVPQKVLTGATITLTGATSDWSNVFSYQWQQVSGPSAAITDATAISTEITAPVVTANTDLVFEFTATDPDGISQSAQVTVTVYAEALTLITPTINGALLSDLPFELPMETLAIDDSSALTFSLLAGPAEMSIDAQTGVVQWTPAASDEGSSNPVTVSVTDSTNTREVSFSLDVATPTPIAAGVAGSTVTVTEVGSSLEGLSITLPNITALSDSNLALTANDVQISTIDAAQAAALPSGVTALTDLFQATPVAADTNTTIDILLPAVTLPAGRTTEELYLFVYSNDVLHNDQPSWLPVKYNAQMVGDRLQIPVTVMGELMFIGLQDPTSGTVNSVTVQNTVIGAHTSANPCNRIANDTSYECSEGDHTLVLHNFVNHSWPADVTAENVFHWFLEAVNAFATLGLTAYDSHVEIDFTNLVTATTDLNAIAQLSMTYRMFYMNLSAPGEYQLLDAENQVNLFKSALVNRLFVLAQVRSLQQANAAANEEDIDNWVLEGLAKWFEDYLYNENAYQNTVQNPLPMVLSEGLNASTHTSGLFAFWKLIEGHCNAFNVGDLYRSGSSVDLIALRENLINWDCDFAGNAFSELLADGEPRKKRFLLADALAQYQYITVNGENGILELDPTSDNVFQFDRSIPKERLYPADRSFTELKNEVEASVSKTTVLVDQTITVEPNSLETKIFLPINGSIPEDIEFSIRLSGTDNILMHVSTMRCGQESIVEKQWRKVGGSGRNFMLARSAVTNAFHDDYGYLDRVNRKTPIQWLVDDEMPCLSVMLINVSDSPRTVNLKIDAHKYGYFYSYYPSGQIYRQEYCLCEEGGINNVLENVGERIGTSADGLPVYSSANTEFIPAHVTYYESGQIESIQSNVGRYRQDYVLDGVTFPAFRSYYDESGALKEIRHYIDGNGWPDNAGELIGMSDEGLPIYSTENVPFEPQHIEYYESGQIKRLGSILEGVGQTDYILDGVPIPAVRNYYETGVLRSEERYNGGLENGLWVYYYENGNISMEAPYQGGGRQGVERHYYEDGTLRYESAPYTYTGIAQISVRNGIDRSYYPNGNLESETPYVSINDPVDGWRTVIVGIAKGYYQDGTLESESAPYSYTGTALISVRNGIDKYYDENGDLIKETPVVGKNDPVYGWITVVEGTEIHYSYNSVTMGWFVSRRVSYVNNLQHGVDRSYSYFANGELYVTAESQWTDGERDGFGRSYIPYLPPLADPMAPGVYQAVLHVEEQFNNGCYLSYKRYQYVPISQPDTYLEEQRIYDNCDFGSYEITYNWPDGTVDETWTVVDYLRNGPYRSYNENGFIVVSGQYTNGAQSGVWTYYTDTGITDYTVDFGTP